MLSTDIRQELTIKRIEEVVSIIMEEHPLFREDLNSAKMVQDLVKLFEKNLPFEEFDTMSNEELKEHCSFIMATEMLTKIGESFTPEELAIFDEAVKRK